jgi:SAM-dependent methyltransferase
VAPEHAGTKNDHPRSDGKACFDDVYDFPDPRKYFRTLRDLEYQSPAHGARVFSRLVDVRCEQLDRDTLVVLDLCCSYGINAILLNHHLELRDLYGRYCSPEFDSMSTDELIVADRAFYAHHRRSRRMRVVGIDIADNAVRYAQRIGVHWQGSSENLENEEPSEALIQIMQQVDLITLTGGLGYISDKTIGRVIRYAVAGRGCWVAAFVPRWVDYGPSTEVLARHGLETEKLGGYTFRQRRFVDPLEQARITKLLQKKAIDPEGKESQGWYHTTLLVSRPAGPNEPLDALLSGCIE